MVVILWFLLGALSTLGIELVALEDTAAIARADIIEAKQSFEQKFADVGSRLDRVLAKFNLPF